tara:strand:- start:77478 stop:78716 length:1239 start_codon:yes stop_codon:yes gene_type:complete
MKKLLITLMIIMFASTSFAASTTTKPLALDKTNAPAKVAAVATTPAPSKAVDPFAKYLVPSAPDINAKSYILMDVNSHTIIAQKNADEKLPPASLTKLMTLYLTFKELASNQIHLNDKVRISVKAWRMGGSKMFVKEGNQVPVEDLIRGIIVMSGNDATTALAEYIGGSESTFVQMMNQQAKILGMKNTHYTDATGLPHPDHYATAHDLAILATAIINQFPQYYHYFSEKWFTWNNIRQNNRNLLLWRDPNVDGMKTGHTSAAGYCLIASAKDSEGMRVVSVVMGTPSEDARATDADALVRFGFRFYQTHKLYSANQTVTTMRVYAGANKNVNVGLTKDLYVTIPANAYKDLKASTDMQNKAKAPVAKNQQLGTLNVTLNGNKLDDKPLVALQADPKGGMWRHFSDWLGSIF